MVPRLEDLRLRNINLYQIEEELTPEIEACQRWCSILQTIRDTLHLKRATFSGWIGVHSRVNAHVRCGWNLDTNEQLAVAVERCLIEGGQCALNADNAEQIDRRMGW
jgi:hypothetical protein